MNRSLFLTENKKIIIRNDTYINGTENLEMELFKFLKVLESKKMINSKKLMNMLKIHNNDIGIKTIPDILFFSKSWMLNENTKNTLEVK